MREKSTCRCVDPFDRNRIVVFIVVRICDVLSQNAKAVRAEGNVISKRDLFIRLSLINHHEHYQCVRRVKIQRFGACKVYLLDIIIR